jgi:hypothetical protein
MVVAYLGGMGGARPRSGLPSPECVGVVGGDGSIAVLAMETTVATGLLAPREMGLRNDWLDFAAAS